MGHSRESDSFAPGRRFAQARFRRWFGRYFLLAAFVFALGGVLGAVTILATDLRGLQDLTAGMDSLFPAEITFQVLLWNNLRVLAILACGVVSFGVLSGVVLLFNGFVVGVVVAGAAGEGALVEAVALIAPHAPFELGAFFLVGGVAFRTSHRLLGSLRGVDDTAVTRQELFEIAVLLLVAVVAIGVAAWIEANLTESVARAVVGPL